MTKPSVALLFLISLALAACGGGGGGAPPNNGGGGPTPTPTPTPTQTPKASSCVVSNHGVPTGYGPADVTAALHFPFSSGGVTYNGAGQTVAVVIDSNINPSDVSTYLTHYGILQTGTITDRPVDGADGGCHGGSQDEATLDVETIAGLAPGANIMIYQMPYNVGGITDQEIADAYNAVVSDKKAFVVNTSLGGCEGSGSIALNEPEDAVMQSGAAGGVVFASSSGDSGNLCQTGPNQAGASYPASDPNGAGVGGTETSMSGGYTLTSGTVWNDHTCTGGICAGGGGVSSVFPIPAVQSGVLSACKAPPSGSTCSTSMRNVPDVSMPAEDVNVYEGGWILLEGTSWSSPEYAAMMAEVYQYCHLSSGLANPLSIPYYVWNHASSDFIDVTLGSDQISSYAPYYHAVAGFDDAGGLGVPYADEFASTACPGGSPASGLSLSRISGMAMSAPRGGSVLDVTPRMPGLVDLGERSANEPTRVQIVLRPEAASSGTEAQVIAALETAGFTIVQRFPNHLVVDAQAPSSAVERLFGTQLHDVAQGEAGTRYMPVRPVVLPASIAPFVATVNLDNVATRHIPIGVTGRLR